MPSPLRNLTRGPQQGLKIIVSKSHGYLYPHRCAADRSPQANSVPLHYLCQPTTVKTVRRSGSLVKLYPSIAGHGSIRHVSLLGQAFTMSSTAVSLWLHRQHICSAVWRSKHPHHVVMARPGLRPPQTAALRPSQPIVEFLWKIDRSTIFVLRVIVCFVAPAGTAMRCQGFILPLSDFSK